MVAQFVLSLMKLTSVMWTVAVAVVDTCRLVRLLRLKSFSPITSGSVARCKRGCCPDVAVAVLIVVGVVVVVLVVALVVAVLVAVVVGRDHISCVLGHPLDQSFSGAVCITLTACGCSLRWGMTMVYCESAGRFCPGLCLASMSRSYGL